MKLRVPTSDEMAGLSLTTDHITSPDQHRIEYEVKVITPIYGGGVEAGKPDKDMPIRATAIRGQLRFWWRLLQAHGPQKLTGAELFKKERAIWGGMSEKDGAEGTPKDFSGKVTLRIKSIKNCRIEPCCQYTENQRTGKHRLAFQHGIPQYAMFPGQGKSPDASDYNSQKDKPHQVILSGLTFCLELSAPKQKVKDEEWLGVIAAVKWWASFGGIGARTRRGLGSVAVSNLSSGQLIELVDSEEALEYGCTLQSRLTTFHTTSALAAWKDAISKLQEFRQGVEVGRNQKQVNGQPETYPNTNIPAQGGSRWPEPDSIREITSNHSGPNSRNEYNANDHRPTHPARISFPRAAFGLPIIFKFNNKDENNGDPQQSELRPVLTERMASPLILKARQEIDGSVAIALLLPVSHLSSVKLTLTGKSNKPDNLSNAAATRWEQNDWDSWPNNWCRNTENVQPISAYATGIKNDNSDALFAFLNYFGGQ